MINGQIRDKEVRVIGQDGEQIGIMSPREAMKLAQEAELDLVKIAPTAKPPVSPSIASGAMGGRGASNTLPQARQRWKQRSR